MEVVIADGNSTDQTRLQIEKFREAKPDLRIRVVENAKRSIPAGLNQALRAAEGEIIVRLDAHSVPSADYVAKCAEALKAGCGENVGGVWQILPGGKGWLAKAISIAAAHPLGAGDARYRIGGRAQAVDTVPFGAFKRSLVERIGYFDETLLTNEDYEFNVRIRQAGGQIWLDPDIHSRYYARSSLKALWSQYWRYGFWKAKMLKRYPKTLRWRQAIPPLFVLSLVVLGLASIWLPVFRWVLAAEMGVYILGLFGAGLPAATKEGSWQLGLGIPLALAVMHLAWGSSVWIGLIHHE
jgi:glycosyltransferase involved in cell wall biosynthesis